MATSMQGCPRCGQPPLGNVGRFCRRCGLDLSAFQPPPPPVQRRVPAPPIYQSLVAPSSSVRSGGLGQDQPRFVPSPEAAKRRAAKARSGPGCSTGLVILIIAASVLFFVFARHHRPRPAILEAMIAAPRDIPALPVTPKAFKDFGEDDSRPVIVSADVNREVMDDRRSLRLTVGVRVGHHRRVLIAAYLLDSQGRLVRSNPEAATGRWIASNPGPDISEIEFRVPLGLSEYSDPQTVQFSLFDDDQSEVDRRVVTIPFSGRQLQQQPTY